MTEAERAAFNAMQDALNSIYEVDDMGDGIATVNIDYAKVEEASGGSARQVAKIVAGISSEKARDINKKIKDIAPKGVQSQTQGDQVRVTGKKRDDLQAVIAGLKESDFGIPLQFQNFRD